jgi:hypothetical protein
MKNFKSIRIIIVLLFTLVSQAQVGINTSNPQAALDITSSTDGFLIPRVALTITTSALPLTSPTISELVYNSATVADVTPGYYYWNGTIWVRLATGVSNNWTTIGNTGIIDGTNFIGTAAATNVDVAFRRNNLAAGKIGATSTSFGVGALNFGATTNSSAFGTNALTLNTGSNNVAVGNGSLASNTSSANNTAIGFNSLLVNTATENTCIGSRTMVTNSTGNQNVAIGVNSLSSSTDGSQNTSIGFQSLLSNSSSVRNTSIGYRSMATLNGNAWVDNVAIGWGAMADAVSGTRGTFIGVQAGRNNTGSHSVAIGRQALGSNNGGPSSGIDNVAIGHQSLSFNTSGQQNTVIGAESMPFLTTGNFNTGIGYRTGYQISTGGQNTFLGHQAGNTINTGTGNVFIGNSAGNAEFGSSSNRLYISNSASNATTSLIYGEFSPSRILRTNSTFQIGDPLTTGYQFPVARGTINQVLQTNAAGVLSWVAPSSLTISETDPQVSPTITNRIPKWNGTTLIDGILVDDATNVGVGMTPLAGNKLDVNGNTRTTNFQMTTGATANYILKSDAVGNATWIQNPINALSVVRANLNANQTLNNSGWQLINFNTTVIDSNTEFASNRFTATRAGIYEINAGYHTDNQSNFQQYSIGVYVNGVLYQQTTGNHSNLGTVSRNINCVVNLTIGGYIEIFAENYQTPVAIDSFSGKTFFEIRQIK